MRRRVPVEGAVNFRDLGGYATTDGQRTRWGRLYRSDTLSDLTDDDLAIVSGLGLRTICDLRDADERATRPNRAEAEPLAVHEIGFTPHDAEALYAGANRMSEREIRGRLREIFRRFVVDQTRPYARMLDALLAPDALPAVIHCTSGRDRTGFAAMIVLTALGVPKDTVLEDYALSDRFKRDITFQFSDNIDPAVIQTLTQTRPEYLTAAYDAMEATWGSVHAYLTDGLGLTAERRQHLRALLLEPAFR